ncbi:hypothetical protein AC482_01575 [miscellaneous Crenarchaeota group-15 archaeon DG-45]|uniref:HD domain-containing protein n=1 Tax=miscellaneous Crenarchaeota group-15 archaeon DG-45 TaxID=1685127 RepID=A0A0M0BRJ2_9ARCH|nr:MAG: hypothetical protein AC482_01575 [miscellaneous Crenarchaeota group-15 archaeon DG-45]
MKEVRGRILAYAREMLKGEGVTGLDHALRVWRWCEFLGGGEGVDMEVLWAAALLHDISIPGSGRQEHHEESARMAEAFLREAGYPGEKVAAVAHAIGSHSRFGGPDPETREAEVLYDADVLDFIGAIGLVRGVARGLQGGGYTGDVARAPELFEEMKATAGVRLHTEKAREIAEDRIRVVEEFIARLKDELEFKC